MSLEGKADTQREGGPDVMMAIVGHLPSLKATSHPGGLRGSDVDKLHYMHQTTVSLLSAFSVWHTGSSFVCEGEGDRGVLAGLCLYLETVFSR